MDLAELIAGIPGLIAPTAPHDLAGIRVCDLTDDSRTVLPGSLFIARVGTRSDGRAFIPAAIKAGAVAILTDEDPADRVPPLSERDLPVPILSASRASGGAAFAAAHLAERFYGNPTSRLTLIGITGTNGKTTTTHLTHQILNGASIRTGLIGTVEIDDGREVAPATLTTPPAIELSRTFATMLEAGCKAAVMESSSHALHQGRVAALRYRVAVFTNLTGDHLDYHGTMANYAAAKAALFTMLPPAESGGFAIVNAEDQWHTRMIQDCKARILGCTIIDNQTLFTAPKTPSLVASEDPACTATIHAMTMNGVHATFEGPWGTFTAKTRLLGRHNVMNALQAAAAAWAAEFLRTGIGLSATTLRERLESAIAPAGRLEPVTTHADPFAVIVDYAHTDDALEKALQSLRPLVGTNAKLAVVFGCGGDRDATKRPRMAAVATRLADRVHITSDNPRTERPSDIIDQILAGVPSEHRAKVTIDADRRRAIHAAVASAQPGDIILIAGKGHETYQIMPDGKGGTITTHFDDRDEARAALAQRHASSHTQLTEPKAFTHTT